MSGKNLNKIKKQVMININNFLLNGTLITKVYLYTRFKRLNCRG